MKSGTAIPQSSDATVYTVLVCEDDSEIAAALEIYLTQDGYRVVKVPDGQAALDVLAAQPIHLVLLDVMMPVLDGIATAATIRKTNNVPIIFLSAKAEDTDRILGLNMGGDDYVTKPFNPVELLARVRAALRRYARLGGMNEVLDDRPDVYQTGGLVLDDGHKSASLWTAGTQR